MESGQTTRKDSKVVFTSGNDSFTVRDLIDSASFRGELEVGRRRSQNVTITRTEARQVLYRNAPRTRLDSCTETARVTRHDEVWRQLARKHDPSR